MLKVLFLIYAVSVCYAWYPGKLYREYWGNQLMAINLINLTVTLCKDAFYKLRMADRIQEQYKYTLPYELGLLTSSITDYFKHMTRIYRYYSNHKDFKSNKLNISHFLNAYHIMQGEYNLIRAEKDLYYDAIDRFQKKKQQEDKMMHRYKGKNPMMDPEAIKKAQAMGINIPTPKTRRSMDIFNDTVLQYFPDLEPKNRINNTIWNIHRNDTDEAVYKKQLRYKMWADKWKGFNPEIEGVNIPDKVAAVGLSNASNFLLKELKGIV